MYAIIDIETTGLGTQGNKITDISIFVHDGQKVVDEYHTLVNPETRISYKITQLTGITNEMVNGAPKFHQIAKKVVEITDGCIFVAHNVSFDYGVIKSEFKTLGFDYEREKLCTVRLARKIIPGQPSYSLGKICNNLDIIIEGRHRAYGDAKATVELFDILLERNTEETLNTDKKLIIPPLLEQNIVDNLPHKTGVYYFYNIAKEIIYVGKSIDIKTRVISHFREKSRKERAMCENIADVKFEVTGSELIALLKESSEIKSLLPLYNRAQRRVKETSGLFMYKDNLGIINLAVNKLKLIHKPIATFYSQKEAKHALEKLCDEYRLCARYCQLEGTKGRCFNSHLDKCDGICYQNEEINSYNEKVKTAVSTITETPENIILLQEGREKDEKGFILIQNSTYLGYGFVSNEVDQIDKQHIENNLITQNSNRDVQKIISSYINSDKTISKIKPTFSIKQTSLPFNLFV